MLNLKPELFDSKEELYFSWYLEELYKHNIILGATNVTPSFELTEGLVREYTKPMKRVADKELTQAILNPRVYTPDFRVEWNLNNQLVFNFIGAYLNRDKKYFASIQAIPIFRGKSVSTFIETKGAFDQNNMTRLFKTNQSWIFDKYGEMVSLVKIPDLFKKTFTPKKYLLTDKTKKPRVIKFKVKTLAEFIKQI